MQFLHHFIIFLFFLMIDMKKWELYDRKHMCITNFPNKFLFLLFQKDWI